jgi:hypothetical protein
MMHYQMLVTTANKQLKSSLDARQYVRSVLLADPSLSGADGKGSSVIADWFVIGGRSSGEFSRMTWGKQLYAVIDALEESAGVHIWGWRYTSKELQRKQQALKAYAESLYQQRLPKELQGLGLIYDRDMYAELGYEDDAMLVTQQLYDTFLRSYEAYVFYEHPYWSGGVYEFRDLDGEYVNPDFIGRKWLVVVDYHV